MTAESMIDYEALAQEAMRNVVRTVLTETAEKGLPGDHHFYISFDTLAPGVILSKRLREKYAEEMTIVLQHRFWDLIINEHRFEVKLTFDGIPERLVVPFKAIRVFFDPSVRYGLQFENPQPAPIERIVPTSDLGEAFDDPFADRDFEKSAQPPIPLKRDASSSPSGTGERPASAIPKPKRRPRARDEDDALPQEIEKDAAEHADNVATAVEAEERGAEIVSLDAFRKK
jgi:hypothetical protein